MAIIGGIKVGKDYPVRIMGIINASPESFYKKSIVTDKTTLRDTIKRMEDDGADFVDVGGMSTAPYLDTIVSEETEAQRVLGIISVIQNSCNIPISVDTCRAFVAKAVLECGVDIINDISGLKHDKDMRNVISDHLPSLILCAYGDPSCMGVHTPDNTIPMTKNLLLESIQIAQISKIPSKKIVVDPSIGFFRGQGDKGGSSPFSTQIKGDWVARDLAIIKNLSMLKGDYPVLVSVSNKSFLGRVLYKEDDTAEHIFGTAVAETVSVLNGADIIRTHNVHMAKDVSVVASSIMGKPG